MYVGIAQQQYSNSYFRLSSVEYTYEKEAIFWTMYLPEYAWLEHNKKPRVNRCFTREKKITNHVNECW